MVSSAFAKCGFAFLKFNFSYNGGTVENPIDFPDEEAFSQNNYSTELGDLKCVLNWIQSGSSDDHTHLDSDQVFLIGHSRGGGIALLGAAQIPSVKKLALWASVSDFEVRFPYGKKLEAWKESGVMHVANARTGQQLPHLYQFFEDFKENWDMLDIRSHAKKLDTPTIVCHGSNDEAVHFSEAMKLYKWTPNSSLHIIPDTGHTFGSKHPWDLDILPEGLDKVVELTVGHFR